MPERYTRHRASQDHIFFLKHSSCMPQTDEVDTYGNITCVNEQGKVLSAAALARASDDRLVLIGEQALSNGSSVAPDIRAAALMSALLSADGQQGEQSKCFFAQS